MKFKAPVPTEQIECEILAEYLEILGLTYSHVPNETFTKSWKQKQKNTNMGVKKGVPDYIIFIDKDKCFLNEPRLIFIEMKRSSGGYTSPEQKDWIGKLAQVEGVEACVCRGFDEAKKILDVYLRRNDGQTQLGVRI